ncbi:MAG: deoxyribonuclease IV [Candidatus Dormibacteria bacterium]
MPVLGAHVETRGGLHHAFANARAIGADAIQVHPTPPGFWGSPKLDPDRVAQFAEARIAAGTPPFYFHAVYLINLAAADATMRARSEGTLAGYLRAADELGIDGVIFHTGSHKGAGWAAVREQVVGHLKAVLERADPSRAMLLIENNAGAGGCVGARFEEIAEMLEGVRDPRVGVCFDTCHAFASGYDFRTEIDVAATLNEFDRTVGLQHLRVVHCNDSQTGLASNRDRHQNLGEGEIGAEGFSAFLRHPAAARLPFILEVPGSGEGPNAREVSRLRELAGMAPVTPGS